MPTLRALALSSDFRRLTLGGWDCVRLCVDDAGSISKGDTSGNARRLVVGDDSGDVRGVAATDRGKGHCLYIIAVFASEVSLGRRYQDVLRALPKG